MTQYNNSISRGRLVMFAEETLSESCQYAVLYFNEATTDYTKIDDFEIEINKDT